MMSVAGCELWSLGGLEMGFGNAGMLQAVDTSSGGRWVVCFLRSLKAVPNYYCLQRPGSESQLFISANILMFIM